MSPESLMGNLQGPESDLWALGILLYELHMGKEPFSGKSSSDMLHLISNQPIKFSSKNFSREAMNLVKSLLKFKADKRMKLSDLIKCKFLEKFRKSKNTKTKNNFGNLNGNHNENFLLFNPPKDVFTTKFSSTKPAKNIRKSRPMFNNMRKFKCLLESKTSLYQPLNWKEPQKSTRQISRIKKPPKDKIIRPKIYLTRDISTKSQKRKKTFSDRSMKLLSKDENYSHFKEIRNNSIFKKSVKKIVNPPKKNTTTALENRKNSLQNKKQNSNFLNINLSSLSLKNKSLSDLKLTPVRSKPHYLSSLNILRGNSRDRFENSPSPSKDKHFVRSNKSEVKLFSKNESNPINLLNSPVRYL
jgi:serine/threonine protein kinase